MCGGLCAASATTKEQVPAKSHLLAIEHAPNGLAALAGVGGVTALRDKVALHVVKQAVVVVLDLAQPVS